MIAPWLLALALVAPPGLRQRAALFTPGLEPARPAPVYPAMLSGRVLTRARLHIGVRPHAMAAAGELGAALTLQIAFDLAR